MKTVAGQFRRASNVGNGGAATNAAFFYPTGLWPDGSGGYFLCDSRNNIVRRVYKNGTIVAAFGTGAAGWSGDGGPARLALLNNPVAMSDDGDGGYFIVEGTSNTVRRVRIGSG